MNIKKWLLITATVFLTMGVIAVIALDLYRPPAFIQNFEQEEFGGTEGFLPPTTSIDGLAVYSVGVGDPVLLMPYPHGHTTEPMAQGPLAQMLLEMGYRVITFDVPGAYASTRAPAGDIQELIRSADETLDYFGIESPTAVVGHSMSGFTALAYAIERPDSVQKLVLANSVSGFPAAARCGFPGTAFSVIQADYWRVILWGMRINSGRGDLALHKQLYNLMQGASFHDPSFFAPLEIDEDDKYQGVPIRMIWSRNMYSSLSYADRLGDVRAPTLVIAGRHDPQASMACSEELTEGIPDSRLVVFERSGHAPFIEEGSLFVNTLHDFLGEHKDN
jgi:proline iminopeptidase